MSGNEHCSLSAFLGKDADRYQEAAMRLLFCTSLLTCTGENNSDATCYRICSLKIVCSSEKGEGRSKGLWLLPGTSAATSSVGVRVGLAPLGIEGGIRICGLLRCDHETFLTHQDHLPEGVVGARKCQRELLMACGVEHGAHFQLNSLVEDGLLRLQQHGPRPLYSGDAMEWAATRRAPTAIESGKMVYHMNSILRTKMENPGNESDATAARGVFLERDFNRFRQDEKSQVPSTSQQVHRQPDPIEPRGPMNTISGENSDAGNGSTSDEPTLPLQLVNAKEESDSDETSTSGHASDSRGRGFMSSPNTLQKKQKVAEESDSDESTTCLEDNHLQLKCLFPGAYGPVWENTLAPVLSNLSRAASFMGPNRSRGIVPARELTFRAILGLPPEMNNVIVFGQAPYPSADRANGIAMFDSLIHTWECAQFGKTTSMRNIIKAAAVAKGIVPDHVDISTLRRALTQCDIVSPQEWFQAMMAQGVLFLNASLTCGSNISATEHTQFWMPVMSAIVRKILQSKKEKFPPGSSIRRVCFLWWGKASLTTKQAISGLLEEFEADLTIVHMDHLNPAARGKHQFFHAPNHFSDVNAELERNRMKQIDWLPTKAWLQEHQVYEHSNFIADTCNDTGSTATRRR